MHGCASIVQFLSTPHPVGLATHTVTHSRESQWAATEKGSGSEQVKPAELIATIADPSEEDPLTLAVPQAHADNNEAFAWQERL